ncbi:tRNA pseudouridine(38-40) synthase TruA [Psychrobacillus psychrodurans]|uniref:tRNA pseudouridine(38-40) synthase TruA n=1 Tax=Psychrobacillus TaxID=1221880 RepID=UPI0008E82C70|nr:tRNA pseudouridine(38-40) synthase TruA [Psychrobacillus psychrodurans]MCZ8540886.1 tRNA pseudouridine(38-40) synthase TruA [Psychrobacillus psychrodurans]SFM79884.1 tRNA pseudouridine38-40 synthase [Psychrobacillus psychrodurans]
MRLRAIISYDGSQFSGYQVQPGKRTVQLEIERVLETIHKGAVVKIVASGRTDAGVHATGQVIHFDSPLTFPLDRWCTALNVQLPGDIRILSVEQVSDDFHARYHAIGKTYRYIWSLSEIHSPFERDFSVHADRYKPDIASMQEAAQHLLGTHDFSSFCAAKTNVNDFVRTIYSINFEMKKETQQLHMVISGSGFLYNMVRIIAGTLWEVGIRKKSVESLSEILLSCSRKEAGKTAPAHGLYLEKVAYDE